MNQKVQRKMGGGGAKSKNAPKFTEAITQGLGPMLYGAARGTAAGLAGIGGDIEELARLGINYAGDKLQGRFPNMLDKRDVVGAKATLPTSELVLSKIPSLKDFGAGPEARHSEDIAAKLGMYGLSNIAAPKAGKAVVQGVNATGKALAPKAGEMLENYMVRTGGILPMDVWHGSPHRFPPTAKNPLGEFDPMKIGTGEGAQAYGHGLYLAENPRVAKGYQKDVTRKLFDTNSILGWGEGRVKLNPGDSGMLFQYARGTLPPIEAAKKLKINAGSAGAYSDETIADAITKIREQTKGNLYKVDLPDEQIAKMLDWDKPLSEGQMISLYDKMQQGQLSSFAKPFQDNFYLRMEKGNVAPDGQDLFMELSKELGGQKYVSDALRDLGIPGIRYLDGGSRAGGKGTSNFVVFPGNEEMLNILSREKDGGLVHGKKNGGEAKKPFSNDFERRKQMAGSVMPSQREMEEALRPATVNSLLKRAADRRQGKAMQEEPESPEVIPEGEVRPYDPTFKQNKSANIQRGLESLGFPKPRARSIAQNIMGEGGIGIADFVPFVGTGMSLQETKRAVERARDKGDQTGVVTELGLGALNAAAGLWGTNALTKNLASRIKKSPYQRYSQAEFDRILRESAAQESQRLLPTGQRLLNGPTEQLLLNAPKREKTANEMRNELAQYHATLPKPYGLEMPPGNTAAQRLEAMGFTESGYSGKPDASAKSSSPIWITKNPAVADTYTAGSSPNVMPLKYNKGKQVIVDAKGQQWSALDENTPIHFPERMVEDKDAQLLAELLGENYRPLFKNEPKSSKTFKDLFSQKLFNKNLNTNDLARFSAMNDYDSLMFKDIVDRGASGRFMSKETFAPSENTVIFNPENVRSAISAAGDPFRRNAAIAAATGMAAPDLLAEEYANGGEVTSDDLILIERRR
jgi:hypothetical protein